MAKERVKKMWVCPECFCADIQYQGWTPINPLPGEPSLADDNSEEGYYCSGCEERGFDGHQKFLYEIDINDKRVWRIPREEK